MIDTLASLSLSDLVVLAGVGDKPIFSSQALTEASLQHSIAWILGRRRWCDLVQEALARGDLAGALEARARGHGAGETLSAETEDEVVRAWAIQRRRVAEHRDAIGHLPEAADAGLLFSDVATIHREARGIPDLRAELPATLDEVRHALDHAARLQKLAGDAASVRQLVSEEAVILRGRSFAAVRTAIDQILAAAERPDVRDEPLLVALRAVAELWRERDLATLARLAQPGALADDELVSELAGRLRGTPAAADRPFYPPSAIESGTTPSSFRLSAISDTLHLKEPRAPRGFETRAEFEAHRDAMRLQVSDEDIGSRWMRTARATSVPELHRLALGHALLAYGRAYLDRDQFRLATELLRDAVISLSLPAGWFDGEAFELAATTLVTSRVWPRMARKGDGARPSDLAGHPERIFAWLYEHRAVDVVAELWADLPDGADERFFEVLLVRFGNAIELRHACASAALTAPRLRARSVWTVRRVLGLLRQRSKELSDALYSAATELGGADATLKIGSREILKRTAVTVRTLLNRPPSDPLAVAIAERLGDLLVRIADADAHGGEAKLSIAPAVHAFFPRECSTDVYLPITVDNERTGGPASETTVQVAYDGSSDDCPPRVEIAEFAVPLLDPGDSFTGRALLQLDRDPPVHVQSWSFKAMLRRGSEVLSTSRFSVNVRERSRRPNPFSAGQAVQEDEYFIGRKPQLDQLRGALCGDRRDITPLVYGLRRIGKTSLVHRLLRDPEVIRRYMTSYWDVEDLPPTTTTVQFLMQFAERVRRLLPPSCQSRDGFRREAFRSEPYTAFETFCDAVAALDVPRTLLVAIDEFDNLVHIIRDGEQRSREAGRVLPPQEALQPQTLAALRKMLMKGGSIRLVLAGLPDILRGQSYDDRLFGLVHAIEVGAFQREEADAVVGMADLPFSGDARERLYDATGMQPYLLQLLCYHVYARMMSSGRDRVTTLDLQEAIDLDIVPNEATFTNYLELIRDDDRPLLRALARAQQALVGRRRFVTPGEVAQELWKVGDSAAGVESVSQQLGELSKGDRPLVAESGDRRGNFRLVIGLLADRLALRSL